MHETPGLNQKKITRKRAPKKPRSNKLDLAHRGRYIKWILSLHEAKTILISCNETFLSFGSTGHIYVSAPRGVTVYTDKAEDPRFVKMQWDATASGSRITRPCVIWNKKEEEEEETYVLLRKLAH